MFQMLFENPQLMEALVLSDPRMRTLMEERPELRAALTDSSNLRFLGRAIRNPKLMKELMRNQDRMLSNIEALPGGFNHLSSMFKSTQGPLSSPRSADPSTGKLPLLHLSPRTMI
eukprot:jgi/Hompol1/635/HPOL_004248-RA